MTNKSLTKSILAVALSIIMLLSLIPLNTLASDAFPGKPDGMTISGSSIETINGQTVWLCPSSGGNIVNKNTGNGYAIYDAAPYGGYTFSHWATYCVADDWLYTFESENRYTPEEGYAFSKTDSKTSSYNKKDNQIRVNISNEANYTYYVYAVFVKGYKMNVSVDGKGEIVAARNLSNYLGSEYETYVEHVKNTEFIAPSGIKLQIDFNAESGHHFDNVLINNQDKTADYISGNTTSFRMIIDSVQSDLDIQVTTKLNEYTLTFHGNGGTTADGADSYTQTYTYGSNPTIAENRFEKSGYTLSRWNTAADSSGTNYGDKQIMTKNQSLDLYAVWTEQHDHSDSDGDGICDICGVIPYVHRQWNETTTKVESIEQLTPDIPTKITSATTKISNSWYVVQGNVSIDGTLEVDGEVHLVLANGAKLTVGGGINVGVGNSLHIYSQSDGTGTLVATGSEGNAGIGGKNFSACGTVVIHGGNITASGSGEAAGIGGGGYWNGGTVTIFGGSITAHGCEGAAGIGGGKQSTGDIINIYGGTVVALGGNGGAGIGGGLNHNGETVRIYGGNVKAIGGGEGENIGAGASGVNSGTLTDGNNTPVSLTTITLDGAADGTPVTAVEGITGYGLTDVKTLDTDKLYFYLPANSTPTGVTADGQKYKGSVENGQGTFTKHQHNWEYSNFDNTITAQCTTDGCANSGGSATLVQDADVPTFYTGFAIEALKVNYSDNWQGGNLTINYSDNTNVGTAKGSISIGNAEVKQTFEISYFSVPGNAYRISGEAYINESVYWFGGSHITATVTPAADYQISKEQNGIYTDSIVFNNGDKKIYLKRISDGAISDSIDLSDIVKFDTTLPNGEIRLDERSRWQEFINFITFGLFYKEDKSATVSYSDADSGVKSVEYYLASEDLIADNSLDNAAAARKLEAAIEANWNTYSTKIDLNGNAKNVIYVKITDNVGNVTYLSSDGIVLDSIAPTLEGIEDGQTYYGNLTVIKSAEQFYDIKTVTLDGEAMDFEEGTYGLIPADNAEHTVVVEDHAGNKTTYTVTVMKNYTVTYKADGETVATVTVGHGHNVAFPKVPKKDGYVGKWDRNNENITSDTVINAVYTEIPVVKPDEVKPEDKADLVDTKEKLEEQLKDDSYTQDDKKDIQDAIDNIDDALEVIGNVENVEELIDKLPDTIKMDDEPAIKAADDAYNALTDYEKSLVDEDAKKALDDAKSALAELNKSAEPNSPQTGDNSNMALWMALLFISGGAVIRLTVCGKKRRTAKH